MQLYDVIRTTALMAVLFNLALTLLVLGTDLRSRLHRVYVLWGISVALWNFGVYRLSHSADQMGHEQAFFWALHVQARNGPIMPLTIEQVEHELGPTRAAAIRRRATESWMKMQEKRKLG